jgi:hypothetical protein
MPIYQPIPTGGRLHLKLGYVCSGVMTPGSTQITNLTAFPIGSPLSNSDVGTQASVIGAGPSPPFTPTYPAPYDPATGKTPYPGTLLVSKIVSVGSGTMVLADAAVNPTQPGAANVTVYREVSTDINNAMKVQSTLTTSCRATLDATIFDPIGALDVRVGMPVLLYDDFYGPYFGGMIDTVKARNIPGRVPGPNPIYWDISCVSWSRLLDRRLVNPYIPPPAINPDSTANKGNPLQAPARDPSVDPTVEYGCTQPGQFINMNVGDIINQLVFNYCESEGLSTNLANNTGPVIPFFQANPGQDTIAQAIDNAAQAGADLTHSYVWWIDPWKKVYFTEATSIPAPWNVDETSLDPTQNDSSVLLEVSVETTSEKLCNSVLIDSSQTIGAATVERYYGDASKHSYSMGRPLGGAPVVYLNIVKVFQVFNTPLTIPINDTMSAVLQRVAVKGGDDPLVADLYWSLGDNTLEQMALTTLYPLGINSGQTSFTVTNAMKHSIDNQGYMIQIDSEWMELVSGSTTLTWNVRRGRPIRGVPSYADQHENGATIYPAAPLTGKPESIIVTYPPLSKQTFTSNDNTSIGQRFAIEGGTGLWQSQISISYPFSDTSGLEGADFAQEFTANYGDPPAAFAAETYRFGLAVGQMIFINLLRPPINPDPATGKPRGENFLIDQVDFSTTNKRQLWSFHGINGALIGDWRKAFMFNKQGAVLAGGGSELSAAPGPAGSPIWIPGGAFPITGDPIFSASSFGIAQDYVGSAGGGPLPELIVTGNQAQDSSGAGIPILWKVRREYVSGAIAQEGIVAAGHIVLGGNPPADLWKGRVISKLANRYGNISPVPLLDFTIVTHTNTGDFTVTPDPAANGCQTGDLFTIRTGRAQGTAPVSGSDAVVGPNTYSDPTWNNVYNNRGSYNGLVPGGNVGNYALVIAGTGKNQEAQQITANDETSITVSPGWATEPDATSCIIIIDTAVQQAPPQNASTAPTVEAVLPVANYNGMVVRVEAYLSPQSITEGTTETAVMREIYVWGAQSSRVIYFGDTLGMFKQDHTLIFDTSGVTPVPPATTLAADLGNNPETDTAVELATNYTPPNGTVIQVGAERMYVLSGSGTPNLTVNRASTGGGAIATHSAGDTVNIPGEFRWTIIPFSAVPNQEFIFVKAWWGTDINYVRISPAPTDPNGPPNELPDGEPFHILGDISSANGTFQIKVPEV